MANFKKYSYSQSAMVVIDFEEQLQPGTFEFTLHKLIDNHIDLSVFYEKYNNDAGGRTAYDPAILLKIILFAYSRGITSSRDIQWQCEHNIIFKALSCDSVPHFTSIANFVSSYPDAIESVFEQVLVVCDQQGLLGKELFAIDGCKLPSNAAKEHSGTLDELAQKREKIRKKIRTCLKEHKKLDGRNSGERDRKQQLAKATDTLQKEFERIDQFLKTETPRMGQGKLTDCRTCPIKERCMRNPDAADSRKGAGRQVSFTCSNGKTATDWMKKRVDSRYGKVIYSHRMSTVEPVFGNIGANKGLTRFSLRGKRKVQGQWQLFCLVHNIEKLMNYAKVG